MAVTTGWRFWLHWRTFAVIAVLIVAGALGFQVYDNHQARLNRDRENGRLIADLQRALSSLSSAQQEAQSNAVDLKTANKRIEYLITQVNQLEELLVANGINPKSSVFTTPSGKTVIVVPTTEPGPGSPEPSPSSPSSPRPAPGPSPTPSPSPAPACVRVLTVKVGC